MTTSHRPQWFKVQTDVFDNVKIGTLMQRHKYASVALWFNGLAYATANLTDGYIPGWLPKRYGFRALSVQNLIELELWHKLEIDPDLDGWLINDFLAYQPSKEHWYYVAEQRKAAAMERWHSC